MTDATTLIYHQSKLVRASISRILEANGFRIIDAAARDSGVTAGTPDLVLFDIGALRTHLEAFKSWCAAPTKVVVLGERFFLGDLKVMLRFGIDGFILNRLSPTAFVLALEMVLAGEKVCPTELVRDLFSRKLSRAVGDESDLMPESSAAGDASLRGRDIRILDLLAQGCTNRAIGQALNVPEDVAKLYVRQAMRRIGVTNRTKAAIWAIQSGIARDAEAANAAAAVPA